MQQSTTLPKQEFEHLLEQITTFESNIKTAKTKLKKNYFIKKLAKERQKLFSYLLNNAANHPELLENIDKVQESE